MKATKTVVPVLALLASMSFSAPAMASQRVHVKSASVQCRVTLHVAGSLTANTTLWVVYGPPAPWFGIARMHRTASGAFTASIKLPAGSKARFTYLAGRGTVHTPQGVAPGNPVTTIRETAPMTIQPQLPSVRWSGPTG